MKKKVDYQIIYNFGDNGGIDEGLDGYTTIKSAYKAAMAKAKYLKLDRDNEGFIIIEKNQRIVVRQWGYIYRDGIFYPDSGFVWKC